MADYHEVECLHCHSIRRVPTGDYLRRRRLKAGLTLRAFAARLDLTPSYISYISDIELDRRKPTDKIIVAYKAL